MVSEDQKPQSQPIPKIPSENGENLGGILSPRFKSAAAMAGWDEEALLYASLIVEDTPDRDFKHKRRSDLNFKTPPTNSRRFYFFAFSFDSVINVNVLIMDACSFVLCV